MSNIQGYGKYNGEHVTIIGSHNDKLLIVISHNPIDIDWVTYTEVDNITWVIGETFAA